MSKTATVRILLVDDFAPFRSYVRRILEEQPEWEVIGEAADGVAALRMVAELEPDLILLDIGMPRLNGIEVAQQIGAMRFKIVFLTSHSSQELALLAMATGAIAYVVKWDADRDLPRAIRAAMEGKRFVSNRLSGYGLSRPT